MNGTVATGRPSGTAAAMKKPAKRRGSGQSREELALWQTLAIRSDGGTASL